MGRSDIQISSDQVPEYRNKFNKIEDPKRPSRLSLAQSNIDDFYSDHKIQPNPTQPLHTLSPARPSPAQVQVQVQTLTPELPLTNRANQPTNLI